MRKFITRLFKGREMPDILITRSRVNIAIIQNGHFVFIHHADLTSFINLLKDTDYETEDWAIFNHQNNRFGGRATCNDDEQNMYLRDETKTNEH